MNRLLSRLMGAGHVTTISLLAYLSYRTRERFRKLDQRTRQITQQQRQILRQQRQMMQQQRQMMQQQRQMMQQQRRTEQLLREAESRTDELHQVLRDGQLELGSLQSLAPLPIRYPVLGAAWSIDGFLARAIIESIACHRPRVIFELGSGVSTVLIAVALERLGMKDTRHIAVDHSETYLDICRNNVGIQQLGRETEFWLCPLEERSDAGPPWYSGVAERLRDAGLTLDLVLVDGPPGPLHPEVRRPAMEVLRPFLNGNAIVFLDDAGRPDEQATLQAWRTAHPELDVYISKHGKRFARLTVPPPTVNNE